MATIIIPGRHLITSAFMERYLQTILEQGIPQEDGKTITVTKVIIPITSANQHGSRYNPVPLYARIIGLERLVAPLRQAHAVHFSYVPIPHTPATSDFAALTLKYVAAHTNAPNSVADTYIWCSTPPLITAYRSLGYQVLTAEWDEAGERYHTPPPNEILATLAHNKDTYQTSSGYTHLSEATKTLWQDMPEIPEHIFRLWSDPLLTTDGSLTEERNYATYAVGMSHSALMDIKFNDIKSAVREGKIVDEGCADGALMVRLAETFPDSDIIGIDITGEFIARVEERQRAGEFGKSFVYTYQRNLLSPIFAPESIHTTICNSTLHELWSYGNQESSIRSYLAEKFRQLVPGGRLVIRDVVGPEDKECFVYLSLSRTDGETYTPSDPALLTTPTVNLSTESRFYRFAHDFLHDLRVQGRRVAETKLVYELRTVGNTTYFYLRLKDAMEFLSRKDYHDNWGSEMNEEFAFWDYPQWEAALRETGFVIIHDEHTPPRFSGPYRNEWIIENRFAPYATLATMNAAGALVPLPFPVTTMVLVGEKPTL